MSNEAPIAIPMTAPGGDKVEKLLGEIAASLGKIEKGAKPASDGLDDVAKPSRIAQLASMADHILGAGEKLFSLGKNALATAQEIAELAAQAEQTNRAMTALGPTAQRVEAATNGMVSAAQAYHAQQSLVRSGLRLSNDELVTLTRAAREHAQALGIDTSEALDKLVQSIRNGDAGGLRELGINVQNATTRAGNMENALRSLTREQRNAAIPARTLGEDTAHLTKSISDATGAIAALIAQKIGLQDFFASMSADLGRVTRETLDFVASQAQLPQVRAADEARLASLERFNNARATIMDRARTLGVDVGNLPRGDQLSQAGRDRLSARLETFLARTNGPQGVNTGTGNRVSADVAAMFGIDTVAPGANRPVQFDANTGRVVFTRAQGANATTADFALSASQLRGSHGRVLDFNANNLDRDEATRSDLRTLFAGIVRDGISEAAQETTRRNQPPPGTGNAGPRDSAGVGIAPTNQAALRQAQMELGIANESLKLLGERFTRLGEVMTREEQISHLRAEAARIDRQGNESEDARISRVAQARAALLQALTEERDRRTQLRQIADTETATEAQAAMAALQAARSGQRLSEAAQAQLDNYNQSMANLRHLVEFQTAQAQGLNAQLADGNLPLAEQLRLRQELVGVNQTLTQNQAALTAMGERDRQGRAANLELLQSEFDGWNGLYTQARQARDEHIRLTRSEATALGERSANLQRLTQLENGYRELAAQAAQEAAAARTEEQRNAALVRRLQLLQHLSQVEGQRRTLERQDAASNVPQQLAAKINSAYQAQGTAAEQFASTAVAAYGSFTDAFATALVAVTDGSQDFGSAMSAMLKSLLDMIAKQAIVEALKNVALGIGNLAILNFGGAALNFASAAAWGAVGVAAGVGAGMVKTAPPASTGGAAKGPGTSSQAASAGSGQGGGLTLNIRVDGALMNEGVENSVVRAVDRAGIRGMRPRYTGWH